jgi:DUF2934 family protein
MSNANEERIRKRAYQLHEQRGRANGFALDDWLQAQSEVLGRQKKRKVNAGTQSK